MGMSTPEAPRRFRIRERPARGRLAKLFRFVVFAGLTGFVGAGVFGTAIYSYYAPTVPEFRSIDDYQPKVGTRIYSADNQLIGEFAAERRVLVPRDRIPQLVYSAFTSAEDKRFYKHMGLDFLGIAQAVTDYVTHPGTKLRGASTITQQVAKSLLATNESYEKATERSAARKIREAILAWRLERSLSKDEILYMYVTQIFLGHKAYGVQAAAEHYFQKNVWELTIAEMATLAGLPQRPSDYSPVSRPEAAYRRREYVLRRMLEDGHITQEQHDLAVKEEITVYPRFELYLKIAPYYTEQVRREIVDRYGERALLEDGLRVYTALDLGYQNFGQKAVAQGLKELDKRQGFRGPLGHITKKQFALFRERYRQELGLAEGEKASFADDTPYVALVKAIGPKGKVVELDVAGTDALLPLAGMRWARKPNPNERADLHYVEDASKVLKVGDLVTVRATSKERLAKDEHGWDQLDTIPKDNELPLFALDQEPIANGSLMSVDPRTGYVVAQEGGYNFEDSNFNRAVQACREPGSAFKPIVYSAAIDKLDYTPSTLVDDKPMLYDDPENEVRWKPNNAGMEFRGLLPLRTCLMDSVNTPAIRIAEAVGIDDIIKNARNLGISSPLKRELGTALGSSCTTLYDLMEVYTAINQYGLRRDLHFVRRVVDRYGNILEDHTDPGDPMLELATRLDRGYLKLVTPRKRALDAQTAFITLSLMKNVVKYGTGVGASRVNDFIAGKTGTTDDSYDAWFIAFTKNLVTGVWVGHDQKERPLGVSEQGGRTALPIWVDYMKQALTDFTVKPPKRIDHPDFPPPVGVVKVKIDPDTGLLARPDSSRAVEEWYRAGSEPTDLAPDKNVLDPNAGNIWEDDTQL
jgi:penicillin-binding protein 1A